MHVSLMAIEGEDIHTLSRRHIDTHIYSFLSQPSLFMSHLGGDQMVVNTLLAEQLLVCALLHDNAILEHGNAVGVLDGGEAVGHHDARATLAGLVQRLLHYLLPDTSAGGGRVGERRAEERGSEVEVSETIIMYSGEYISQGELKYIYGAHPLSSLNSAVEKIGKKRDLII